MLASDLKRIVIGVLCTIVLVLLGASSLMLFENVPAGKICVIQSPVSGTLEVYYDPGIKLQMFGKVTYYPKSDIYSFPQPIKPFDKSYVAIEDKSIPIVFNDSGGGSIPGSIRFDYPAEHEKMKLIHTTFTSHDSVEKLNHLLSQYSSYIIGRMGVPYREKNISIISVALDAPNDIISSLSGKIGMLPGVSSKTIYTKS